MSLDERFNQAADNVKKLKNTPADKDLLELYSYFKQGSLGDCNTDKPGFLDFKNKAKWEAWNGVKGMSQDEAKEAYIKKAEEMVQAHGLA